MEKEERNGYSNDIRRVFWVYFILCFITNFFENQFLKIETNKYI